MTNVIRIGLEPIISTLKCCALPIELTNRFIAILANRYI